MEGLGHLLQTMGKIKARWNPTLTLGGILLTMYDSRNLLVAPGQRGCAQPFREPRLSDGHPQECETVGKSEPWAADHSLRYQIARCTLLYGTGQRDHQRREAMMPPKQSLGKGLGAMFPDLMNHVGDRPAFILCGIEELTPNRFQPRRDFNDEDQRELVASVKKSGIIQPIICRKSENGYEIIAGERRWRAAQAAGMKEVPIVIRAASDRDLAELSLIENIQRAGTQSRRRGRCVQDADDPFFPLPGRDRPAGREGPLHRRQYRSAAETARGGQKKRSSKRRSRPDTPGRSWPSKRPTSSWGL